MRTASAAAPPDTVDSTVARMRSITDRSSLQRFAFAPEARTPHKEWPLG